MQWSHWLNLSLAILVLGLAGCETTGTSYHGPSDPALAAAIAAEPQGDYYIGRRYYKRDYKVWGWVRRPGESWRKARLVMMNENTKLAPDRAAEMLGSDNNHEYRLHGHFSGGQVYEPASNSFYPEFVLTGYELVSPTPPMIYTERRFMDPRVRILAPLFR